MEELDKKPTTVIDRLNVWAGALGAILILAMGFIVCLEIFMRFVLKSPTSWVAEISIFFAIAAALLPLGYVQKMNAHVKVDFITAPLPKRTANFLEIVTFPLILLLCGVLIWEGTEMAYKSYKLGEVSPLLSVPLYIPLSLIPIAALLLTLQFLAHLKNNLLREFLTLGLRGLSISAISVTSAFVVLLILSIIFLKSSLSYLALLILFFVLLFSGIPVSFALALFGLIGFFFVLGGFPSLMQAAIVTYSTLDSFVMVALPLFLLNSTLLKEGGVGPRIFQFINTLVRHLPGGFGIAVVIFCGIFAAMTGSSVAVASAVSIIALPELLSRGYSRKFSIGLLAAGGTLGILFPPSLALIVYASMTMESLGSLFMAGIIPGLLLMAMFIGYTVVTGLRDKNIRRDKKASYGEIRSAFKHSWGGLMVLLIIIGGIYSGIFTPTEAGAVAALYGLVLCTLFYRSLSWDGLKKAFLEAIKIYAMILFIIVGANITGQYFTMSQIPQKLLASMASLNLPPWLVILSINIFLIIMGGPLEAISILVITLPILYPLITGMGLSGVWFAIIMVINMELALISPPEGLNLFILQNLAKATTSEVSWGVLPYLVIIGIELFLISCFPSIAMWLPTSTKF